MCRNLSLLNAKSNYENKECFKKLLQGIEFLVLVIFYKNIIMLITFIGKKVWSRGSRKRNNSF